MSKKYLPFTVLNVLTSLDQMFQLFGLIAISRRYLAVFVPAQVFAPVFVLAFLTVAVFLLSLFSFLLSVFLAR